MNWVPIFIGMTVCGVAMELILKPHRLPQPCWIPPSKSVTLTKVRAQIERLDSARLGSSSLCELGPDLHRDDGVLGERSR